MDGEIFPCGGESTVARHGALKHDEFKLSAINFLNARNVYQISQSLSKT